MSKLKKLTSLFYQTEEIDVKPEATSETVKPVTTSKVSVEEPSEKTVQKFLEALLQGLQENNLEGYDYLEFKESVKEMLDSGFDEEKAIQATATAVKSLASSTKIISSIDTYLEVLNEEKKEFDKVSLSILEEIKKEKEEIDHLEKKISEYTERKNLLSSNIQGTERSSETNKNSFEKAYSIIVKTLEDDKSKLQKVLK